MEFCYRNLTASEENRFDRYFVEKVCAIFSPRLSLRHTPTIYLIAPDPFGEHRFDFSIAGCCPPDGRSIHILRDLALRDLINVTLHELRHAFQKQQNRHNHNSQMRERDARIFELEINCPHGEAKNVFAGWPSKSATSIIATRLHQSICRRGNWIMHLTVCERVYIAQPYWRRTHKSESHS